TQRADGHNARVTLENVIGCSLRNVIDNEHSAGEFGNGAIGEDSRKAGPVGVDRKERVVVVIDHKKLAADRIARDAFDIAESSAPVDKHRIDGSGGRDRVDTL